ncbi:hypothetical protein FACS189464_3040 [Bacteroidia bacterium]|nr:hypothetical protein FACS189430_00040 [Bacteroidia bacterium]GHT78875.1 hypothetical protein FACS189464_3040 [Bacteroidia bacterium]
MNDMHDKYLKDGEITYIGKVDSVKLLPGNGRMSVKYWITDPRAKELQVLWSAGADSFTLDIPNHQPEEALTFMIDPIIEGEHELQFLTNDKEGNSSVRFEASQSVYGEVYKSSLTNRPIQGTTMINNVLSILWGGSLSAREISVNITYETSAGESIFLTLESELLSEPVSLENVDLSKGVRYRTLYLPQPEAIDTFSTDWQRISIEIRTNVVLNKPATSSSFALATTTPDKAVDGNRTTGSWVSMAYIPQPEWIEVDLQGSFEINEFAMWRNTFNIAGSRQFSFQAWIEDEWVDVFTEDNNTTTPYSRAFSSVTTNKVRLYIHPTVSVDYMIRLNEMEVYALVRY